MTLSRFRLLGIAAFSGAALMLSACGGGSSKQASSADASPAPVEENPPPIVLPATAMAGAYDGRFTDSGQPLTILLQDDGSYYLVYSDMTSAHAPEGVVLGDGTQNDGGFTSSNALDLSLIGSGAESPSAASLQATLTPGQAFNGILNYPSPKSPTAFDSAFNTSQSQLPALSTVAGVYTGAIATREVKEDKLEITISSDGQVSGKLSCGCSISATLTLRSDGTSYVAGLSFKGGNHPLSNKSMAGNVYFDSTNKRLYIFGKLSGTTDGAIFVGTRP